MISSQKKQFKNLDVLENNYYEKIFSFEPKLANNKEDLVNQLSKSILKLNIKKKLLLYFNYLVIFNFKIALDN